MATHSESQSQTSRSEGRVSDRVERAAESASEATLARVEAVRDRAETSLEQGRERAAGRIRRVGDVLRAASDELRDDDAEMARFAEMAVERADRAADYIGRASVRSVARDLTTLARNEPIPFFGGAFVVGFSLGRILKNAVEAASEGGQSPSRETSSNRGERGLTPGGDSGFEEHYAVRDPSSP